MKHFFSILFTVFTSLGLFATVHTITNSGNTFTPNTLNIVQGDTVIWSIAANHNVVEVNQTTWNANGSTSNGGFNLPFGGGTHIFNTTGTFYYVCAPHAGGGMKGTVTVAAPPLTQMNLPVTFDVATVNYSTIDFGGNTSSFVADPAGGTNMVVQSVKGASAQVWAGTTLGVFVAPGGAPHDIAFASAIPMSAGNTFMSVRVYSPDAGITVRLKLEDALDNTHTVETDAITTVANAWETLTFDFSNHSAGTAAINYSYSFTKASIFFNFGVDGATAGAKTYFWDDVQIAAGPPPPVAGNIDFAVDMRGYTGALNFVTEGVFINGVYNGWCGNCNPMADLDGDSIYTATLLIPAGMQEFKYTIGGWNDQEALTPGSTCVLTTGPNTNRVITVNGDATLPTVCWNSCTTCATAPPVAGNIDFAVDMRGYTGALNFVTEGVFINGVYNGWCGNCNPMADLDGDSIYTATLLIPAGMQEFKYTIGGWNDQESLTAGAPCVLTTGPNTNRIITVNGDATLPTVCWNSCTTCSVTPPPSGNAQYCDSMVYHFQNPAEVPSAIFLSITNTSPTTMDVIIESADADPVDLLIVTNGTGASISAENYPAPGKISRTLTWIAPTPDIDLNVLWSKVSMGGNWQLTTTDITVSFADTCSSITPPPVAGNIDFAVDMRGYTGALNFVTEGVFINGVYNGWCGNCNPMADLDGDSIYTATLLIPAGMQEFKYTIGGWNDQEALTPGDACVVTTGPNTNRVINVNGDATLPTICWNSCSSCSAVPTLDQMDLPVTFEDVTTVNYVFEDFGGNASMLVVDPTDATNMVAQSTKDITAQLWAGTTLDEVPGAVHVGFVNAIPFSATETTMSVRVWSPVGGIPVRLKAENSSNNTISVETEAMVTAANTWETLVFDFANEATGTAALNLANTYDMVSIFFDFGTDGATAGASRTYYWDDVTFGGSATGPCTGVTPDPMILDDFECQGNISYSFANATWTPNIANPDQSGLNTSSMVGEFIHWGAGTDGAFGGSLDLGPIDISTNNLLKVDVWTNATALPITIVLQNGTPADILSQTKSTSATGMWQTLEFDMLGAASSTDVSNIVIVINPGTTIQDTIYIDNIRFDGTAVNPCESVVADENIMEDFDCQRNLDYQFTEGGFTTIPNPDMSGLNTSANVGQYTRNNTVADAFGGDFIFAPLDFASNNQVKMTVWDANAPSNVTLVLQNAAGVDLGSAVAATTTANVWEDINFDFSAIPNSAGVSKVVILFDAGTQADSGQVYFFDNLRLEGFISGISEINSTAITVYPNPSNDFLNVDVSALESNESLTFTVYSIDGKIVNETILNNTKNVVQLDLTNVTKGFYVLEVASSSKKHLTKFIKN